MKKIYTSFCAFEEKFANAMLVLIAVLVFSSALARTFRNPINWAQDIALLAFAWLVFIGGDIAVRKTKLVGIDMLYGRLPLAMQKTLTVVFSSLIILFLALLVFYGFILVSESMQRTMNTLTISYAWCTLAVPVGSMLMIISSIIKLKSVVKTPLTEWRS